MRCFVSFLCLFCGIRSRGCWLSHFPTFAPFATLDPIWRLRDNFTSDSLRGHPENPDFPENPENPKILSLFPRQVRPLFKWPTCFYQVTSAEQDPAPPHMHALSCVFFPCVCECMCVFLLVSFFSSLGCMYLGFWIASLDI